MLAQLLKKTAFVFVAFFLIKCADKITASNKFRGSTNQPAQLTLENMRDYLHSAPILDLFMKNSTFKNKSKIVAFLKYFYCFFKMSTLILLWKTNCNIQPFKKKHKISRPDEKKVTSANFVNVVKVQISINTSKIGAEWRSSHIFSSVTCAS